MFDVRLKDHLELRGSDSLDLEQSLALAAFWTGILYDRQALEQAVAIADSGLQKRQRYDAEYGDERGYLAPLKKVPEAGMSPGEHWRERFAGTGPSDRSALYEAACF